MAFNLFMFSMESPDCNKARSKAGMKDVGLKTTVARNLILGLG